MESKIKAAKTAVAFKSKKSSVPVQPEVAAGGAKLSFNEAIEKLKSKRKAAQAFQKSETEVVPKIWDEDLAKLEITVEKLNSLRTEISTKSSKSKQKGKKKYKSVCVLKPKHVEEKKMVTYSVMRPAESDATIKPLNVKNHTGPRLDKNGNIIPHSILGSIQAFKDEAENRGEFKFLYDNERVMVKHSCADGVKESSSMKTWRYHNKDWQTLEQYLSDAVSRPVEHLIMNTAQRYAMVQHEKRVVSTALDAERRGHGDDREFRSFWRQQTKMGDDIGGLFATLKKTDRGYLDPMELVSVPVDSDCSRKGTQVIEGDELYPAFYTPYLDEQRDKVQYIIDKIVPHQPEFGKLSVIGDQIGDCKEDEKREIEQMNVVTNESACSLDEVNTRLSNSPSNESEIGKVEPSTSVGPSIMVCGKSAKWEGDEVCRKGQIGLITSVTFDGMTDERVTGYIEIINCGSTSVHFDWKKEEKFDSFHIFRSKIQRFYFFEEGGVIAPGSEVRIPVIFKSPSGGIFSERWKLLTRPVLCGGGDIIVVFKGVAQEVKVPTEEFDSLKKKFLHHKACTVVSGILEELLQNIYTPEPAIPLVDDYNQEQLFTAKNPKFFYHWSTVQSMNDLYNAVAPSECMQDEFSVHNLHNALLKLDEEDPSREEHLLNFVVMTTNLSFHCPKPTEDLKFKHYQIGYSVLQGAIDMFAEQAAHSAYVLKLPIKQENKDDEDIIEEMKKQEISVQQQKKNVKGKKKETSDSLKPTNLLKTPTPGGHPTSSSICVKVGKSTTVTVEVKSSGHNSFCPVAFWKLSKDRQDKYRECLYLQAHGILNSAISQMMNLIEE